MTGETRPSFSLVEGLHYSQSAGDYSGLYTTVGPQAGQLFDPHTGKLFHNNQLIDANDNSESDPGAVAFAKMVLPAATVVPGSPSNNAVGHGTKGQMQWNYTGRIDQTIGSKDFVFFRYSGQELDTNSPSNLNFLTTNVQVPSQDYGASWVHMFGPASSLQVQYARAHVKFNTTTLFSIPGVVSAYGVDSSLSSFLGGTTLMPTLNVSGYFSGGEASNPTANLSSIHQYKATYSRTLGRHDVQLGGGWDQINYRTAGR